MSEDDSRKFNYGVTCTNNRLGEHTFVVRVEVKNCRSKVAHKMNFRIAILALMLGALFIPFLTISNVDSQLVTSTTMTMPPPPSPGQCSIVTLGFSAKAGQRISGTFGSSVTVSFYILSPADLNGIQNCRLSASAKPIFAFEQSVGHGNLYNSLAFPTDGTYYFVFTYSSPSVLGATGEASYLAVELTYPPSITIVGAAGSSTASIVSTIVSRTLTSNLPSSTTTPTLQHSTLSTATSRSTTSESTQALPVSGFTLFGFEMPLTSLLLVIGAAIVAGGGVIAGLMFSSRKRTTHTLSTYLEKIDSTFNQYAVDREECRSRLEQLKRDAIEMLNNGKIEEGHFLMLDEKITQYLKDLGQTTPKHERPSSTNDTKKGKAAG